MTKSLMFQGTGSDVGKSLIVAGLCRVLANRGLSVKPFKPQNMSNNAAVTEDGGEIGRAQWLQAIAARVIPTVHMNPVLLKPQSDVGAQVVVHGQVWNTAEARDYQGLKSQLLDAVMDSYEKLSASCDVVLVEGAGSPAEINLRQNDIANMGFARKADCPVILIGDIDRGGVIASMVGTANIIDPADREMICGFMINKFRGDVRLFDDGHQYIAYQTNWPSLGIVPFLPDVAKLPAEDAVILSKPSGSPDRQIHIVVPMLSRISNFDDFDPLAAEENVFVEYIPPGKALPRDADLIILPGTKSTLGDLRFVREQGWDIDILAHHRQGGHVMGICGGYQMLGKTVEDPNGIEGLPGQEQGLGLLNIQTVLEDTKILEQTSGVHLASGCDVSGYEIHMGRTSGADTERPFLKLKNTSDGGCSADGLVMGTYMHGVFSADAFRHYFLESFGHTADQKISHDQLVDRVLDQLAAHLEEYLDIDLMMRLAK